MAFTNYYMNELFVTVLVLSALFSTTSAVDCYGKSFRCVNSTHFMICVDLGGGVSQAIEDFYIACPPPTVCQGNNHFECEFPAPTTPETTLNNVVSETTLPWEEIVTVSSLNNTNKEFSENYMDTTVERGTTTAVEYSITTDTTVDVTSKTAPDVYINNELNVTEVAATIAAETTTTPVEIIQQTLSEVTLVTQTTENIQIADIESEAQSTADTTNLTQTQLVVAGKESMSDINNTQTTAENEVIIDTVTEQIAPTEQIIQTTTNDPPGQVPAYLYTDLQPAVTLHQNESLTNNTLLIDSTIANKYIKATEKPFFTLDIGTKNNQDLFPISEKANVGKPDDISQNVEITSTVESIVEITTASIEHLISIPNDNISTDVYDGSTVPSFDIKLKPYLSGLREDAPASTKLQGKIESKVTSDKEQNKESQINKIKHAVDEIKPTTGEWVLAPNTENLSTRPYDIFPELAVTTDLPFVNDAKAKAINTTDTNVIDHKTIITFTSAPNNEVTTTLDGIFATESFENGSSSDLLITIKEGQLTKESTQNVAIINLDILTTETEYTTISNNNFQSVTTQASIVMTKSQNSVDSELAGEFIIENVESSAITEQPTTINQPSLTIGTTQNVVIENKLISTNKAINQSFVSTAAINKPTKVMNAEPLMTEVPSLVTNIQSVEDTKLDSALKVNEETMATDTPLIIATQPIVTKGPDIKSQRQNTPNIVYHDLDGRFITENVENTASTKQPTTVYEQSLTLDPRQNVVVKDDIIPTNKTYQDISISGYEPITIINLHTTMTEAPSLMTKTQNFEDKNLDSASIVEFGASTEQTKTINEENWATNTPDIVNAEPMMTEVPSLVTNIPSVEDTKLDPALKVNEETMATDTPVIIATQPIVTEGPDIKSQRPNTPNIVYHDLDGRFITENVENTASTEQPTTVYEQILTLDPRQNVVVKDDIIPTNKTYQDISISGYEPITIINLHTTMTEAPSLMTKTQNFEDKNLDSASIVEFGASTEQTKTINEENWVTNTPDIVNAKPIMTEGIITKTQNSAGTELDGAFINKTTDNIGSLKYSNTINEQRLTMDTTKNVVENITFPTSEDLNRGIMSTEAIHEPSTIINLETMITEAPTLVTKNSESTQEDAAFNLKDIKFGGNTDQFGTTDTSATVATKKNTIPANLAVHTVINNTQPPITEASLITSTIQNPITNQYVTTNTQIEENGAITDKPITNNKKISTTNTEQPFAPENIITPTRRDNLDITTMGTLYTFTIAIDDHLIPVAAEHMTNKDKLTMTQIPTNGTITDRVLSSETVGISAGTIQTTVTNEESVTTDTAHNVASIIISKTQLVKENITAKESLNVIISNAPPTFKDNTNTKVPLLSYTSPITETGSTNVVTAIPAVLGLEQKKPENNLVLDTGLENVVKLTSDTYELPSTNAIELNFNMQPTIASIQGDTVIMDKVSNPTDLTTPSGQNVKINKNTILNSALPNENGHLKASAINIDHNGYANQDNFKIGTKLSNQISSGINVPEHLPSLQYITHGISKQNGINIDLSTSQGPEKESNDISNRAFMSQQGKSERMLVTNDAQFSTVQPKIIEHNNQVDNINLNPLGNYLIDKSNKNPEFARKSSVIHLSVEENNVDTALPDIAFVSQRPYKSTLPATPVSSSISVGHNNREQSTTGTQTTVQNSKNDTLAAHESKMIAKEDSVNVKTSGGLAVVSTTLPTTVAYTTMLDSIQDAYETITAFFKAGSKSAADETGNNFGELGSNAYVFQDKTESENPKNSKDPIPTSQSVTYQYKLITNGQDVPETTSTRISTKGDIINEKVNAPRNAVMLDVLPLPINNVGLRSQVTNIPVVMDFTTKTQHESYKSVTFNPALTNTGTNAGINGVDITTAPTLRNPTLKLQVGVTDKGNASPKNPPSGDSAIVGNLDKNHDVTTFSTLSDATSNLPTEVIDRADISSQQPQQIELGHVEKTIATDYAHIQLFSEQIENKNIQNVLSPISTDNMAIGVTPEQVPEIKNQPKSNSNVSEDSLVNTVDQKTNFTVITNLKYNSLNGSETKSEPQQNKSPKNYALSTQTQKTYASSTVRAPSQSVTQKPIPHTKNITKPVKNDPIVFNCIKGIRGRYSDKDDCRKFYICLGINRPIVGNCPENTVFSDVKKLCTKNLSHCIRQNEFKCPSAGRFSDFFKDNVYYICVSHKSHLYKFKFQCQNGYILNKTIVKCIETKEIESNESVSISSSDSSRQIGSASTVSSSTNSNSISSSKMNNTSNGGDSSSSKSEDSLNNKKSNEAEEKPEQPGDENKIKGDDEDDEDDEVFKCKKEGKFPIRHECRRYYLCKKKGSHQYRRKIKKCESGSLFHKDKKKCVDADDYECY